jgi:hypothetical protein
MSTDLFLNAGFGELLGDINLVDIANMGFVGVRQDYVRTHGQDLVAEFAMVELQPIFLIGPGKTKDDPRVISMAARECAEHCATYSIRAYIEIINEPNLSPRYEDDWRDYTNAVNQSFQAIRAVDPDVVVLAGGVLCTNEHDFDYFERASAYLEPGIGLAFHTYHCEAPPDKPHKGFPNRNAEMVRLKNAARDRLLVCTEIGRHTATQKTGHWPCKKTYQESDDDVAVNLEYEIKFMAERDVPLVVIYQHRDGPKADWSEDRFGILRTDGSKKKIALEMPRIAGEIA